MSKYYFLFPFSYCLIMLALFFHYISTERETTLRWGELSLAVKKQTQLHADRAATLPTEGIVVKHAKIKLGKIQFTFNASNQIIADNTYLTISNVIPLSSGNGFSLLFENSAEQTIPTPKSHAITMTFQVNEIFKDEIIISIHSKNRETNIPFRASFDTRKTKSVHALSEKTIQALSLSGARGKTYVLRILGEGQFKKSKGYWHITAQSPYSILRYGRIQLHGFKTIEGTPPISNSVRDDSKRAIQNYVDKAYRGWMETRYDDKMGTYLHPEGVYGFSEEALAASFAESKRRNEFINNRLTFDRIAHLYRNARTWRTAALRFENPNEILQYIQNIQSRQNSIQQSIQEKNYAILLDNTLVEIVYAFFEERVQRKFLAFINDIPSWAFSPQIATSLLLQYTSISWPEFQNIIDEKKAVLEQIILENITIANAGYLLRQSSDELTVFHSVLAGRYLANFGSTESTKNIGHRMIVTVLNLSDEFGFLPRIYVLKNKTIFSLGFITPEMLYTTLVDTRYYPHARAIPYNTRGVSPSITTQSSTKNLVLLASAPVKTTFATNRIHVDIEITNAETAQYVFILHMPRPHRFRMYTILMDSCILMIARKLKAELVQKRNTLLFTFAVYLYYGNGIFRIVVHRSRNFTDKVFA